MSPTTSSTPRSLYGQSRQRVEGCTSSANEERGRRRCESAYWPAAHSSGSRSGLRQSPRQSRASCSQASWSLMGRTGWSRSSLARTATCVSAPRPGHAEDYLAIDHDGYGYYATLSHERRSRRVLLLPGGSASPGPEGPGWSRRHRRVRTPRSRQPGLASPSPAAPLGFRSRPAQRGENGRAPSGSDRCK